MLAIDFSPLLPFMHSLNPYWISAFLYFFSFAALLILWRIFGKMGLYLYIGITIIAGNIQVLKGVSFPFFPEPIALGTELFMSLFLCSDILAEFYGQKSAVRSIGVGFVSYLLLIFYMLVTLAYAPLTAPIVGGDSLLQEAHYHIQALFTPAPAIFVASLFAYLSSQYADILIFRYLKRKDHETKLWKRTLISTVTGLLIDNILFSILAWGIFSPTPYSISTIWWSYIFGVSIFRLVLTLGYVPLMYLTKHFHKRFIHDALS